MGLIPIPDKSAETVAHAIYTGWICRNAPMEILITDNGREFTNGTIKTLLRDNGVEHRFTSPYHPQTNAQCERQNRTILQYLKSFTDGSTLDWEGLLPSCKFSFNTQRRQSSGFTPYFLRHFQEPMIPFRWLTTPEPRYSTDWAREALLTQQKVWAETYENLKRASQVQRHHYDKTTVSRKFQEGDLVYLHDSTKKPSRNQKLVSEWTGPYLIVRVINDHNVSLKRTPTSRAITCLLYTSPSPRDS